MDQINLKGSLMKLCKHRKAEVTNIICGVSENVELTPTDVLVLLSTYNGEKYIREQLDSVIAQRGVSVHILIRDDGSKDSTIEILKEYSDKPCITVFSGENKGVVSSFNELIMRPEVEQYNYIAFCDQDDIWDDDKLLIAVNSIGDNQEHPILYCSNLMISDENLNVIREMRKPFKIYTKSMSLVQNIGTGCTQVFNRKALEMYRLGVNCCMEMHDYWMTLLCVFLGEIYYDENVHIKYRQHSNNVVGARKTTVFSAAEHIASRKSSVRIRMLRDFVDTYELREDDKEMINSVVNYDKSIFSRVKLLSYKYRGLSIKVTIGFKIRALIGKMY